MRKFTDNLLNIIKNRIKKITREKKHLCRIEEIDIFKKIVIIHCRGINAPIKLAFDEIITDFLILSNLSSKHAAWIGYYYGKHYSDLISKNIRQLPDIPEFYLPNNSTAALHICAINRKGEIIYIDKNNQDKIISPINALTNENIIRQFDPIQACYIGILCGTSILKNSNHPQKKNAPHLKLII